MIMIREDCFAVGKKHECTVLEGVANCIGCPFYKTKEQLTEERRRCCDLLAARGRYDLLEQYSVLEIII